MDTPALERRLSLAVLTLYGIGTILGAGIYVLIGEVAARAGMYAPIAFAVAAAVALLTGASYAELGARLPKAGGEAAYVEAGFDRRRLAMVVGLLVAFTGVVSAATMAVGFAGYLAVFVDLPNWAVMIALLVLLGALAAWGVAESVGTAAVLTLIELAGLVLVLWVARGAWAELPARGGELVPPWELAAWLGIGAGGFVAFYAFIGFEDLANVAEEVREPERNLPRAVFLSLAVTTVVYALVALTAVLALPIDQLAGHAAPMALVYQSSTGSEPIAITAISLFAVSNGALVQIIMASRILYGLSRQGSLPPALGRVNRITRTPVIATAVVAAIIAALAVSLPLGALAQTTSTVILAVFALVNLALWRIKRRGAPASAQVWLVPRWVPLAGCATCLGFLALRLALLLS